MKWFITLVLVCCLLPTVLANSHTEGINVTITESGKITSYLNTYWVVNVEGSGTVTNPSDQDLFDIRLFYDVLGLTVIAGEGDGDFGDGNLYFRRIAAGSTATFNYQIIGIVAQPPTLQDKGVLYTGFAKRNPRVYSDVFGQLQKAPLEDSSITNRNARLISTTFENPSTLEYTIESLRVIKTPELDPNNILDEWNIVNESSPRTLPANGFFVEDFLDYDAQEGEVYWLQSDVFISRINLGDNSNISRLSERNLSVPIEGLNFTNETFNSSATIRSSEYLLRKSVSNTLATSTEPVQITLQLYNFQSTLEDFVLTDTLPAGFVADEELRWEGEVPARNSVRITYDAILDDTVLSGIDTYPSAQAQISSRTIRSNQVPFIRQFRARQNIYVQKSVEYISDDLSSVSISVRNLGDNPVSNITLKEFLSVDSEFSQITQQPDSKGIWTLDSLDAGESWEVKYVTDNAESVRNLPAVYGISSDQVLRTLVLENIVNEAWNFVRTRYVELFGVLMLIGVPFLLVLSRKYDWFRRPEEP